MNDAPDSPEPEVDSDLYAELLGFCTEDRHFLLELQKVVRALISRKTTTAEQIYHLAKLLFALERFPRPTRGIALEFTLGRRHKNGESDHLVLTLDATSFQLETSTWIIPDPAVGGDSAGETVFAVETGGYREILHPTALMDWVEDLRQRAEDPQQELEISDSEDSSEIDWETEASDADWENLESDYA